MKQRYWIAAIALAAMAGAAGMASAAEEAPKAEQPAAGHRMNAMQGLHARMEEHMEKRFQEMDADKDGKASLEEMQAQVKSKFEMMDADHDGGVTLEEMRRHHEAMRKERCCRDGDAKAPPQPKAE